MIKERFTGLISRRVFHKWFGSIRVNGSLAKGLKILKKKGVVGIFPEGSRSITGKIQKVTHSGLGMLALKTRALVIPVGIKGTFEILPRGKYFPKLKRCAGIHFGSPLRFKKKPTRANALKIVRTVMKEVASLSGQKYRW